MLGSAMTTQDLINLLKDHPSDCEVFVQMGPAKKVGVRSVKLKSKKLIPKNPMASVTINDQIILVIYPEEVA